MPHTAITEISTKVRLRSHFLPRISDPKYTVGPVSNSIAQRRPAWLKGLLASSAATCALADPSRTPVATYPARVVLVYMMMLLLQISDRPPSYMRRC